MFVCRITSLDSGGWMKAILSTMGVRSFGAVQQTNRVAPHERNAGLQFDGVKIDAVWPVRASMH